MAERQYILDDEGRPVLEPDVLKWALWFERSRKQRIVRQNHIGKVLVSTVFLGLDHSFRGKIPVLWETMIFDGKHDGYQKRYKSKEEALAGHEAAVRMVKAEWN